MAFINSKGLVPDAAPPPAAAPGLLPALREEEEPGPSLPGAGMGGRFGMRRRSWSGRKGVSLRNSRLKWLIQETPCQARPRSGAAGPTRPSAAGPSGAPGRRDRQTDGRAPPAAGQRRSRSRRRAGELRFPGPCPGFGRFICGLRVPAAPLSLVTVSSALLFGVGSSPARRLGLPGAGRCRGGPAARAVPGAEREGPCGAAGGRPWPRAGWVPPRWAPKSRSWFLFLGLRFRLFSLVRGPCVSALEWSEFCLLDCLGVS